MNRNIVFNITSDLENYYQDSLISDIHEIGNVNIECKIDNFFSLNMSSELRRINSDDISSFIDNIHQNTDGNISFNDGDHSFIGVRENILYFSVFTWKEGAFTDLQFSFPLNDNETKPSLLEMLNKLLGFVQLYEILAERFYRMEEGEEENPEDHNDEQNN